MAIIVEDGTGRADAEAYLSVATWRTYAEARGIAASDYTDLQVEQRLREATQFLDTHRRYKAVRATATQALEFPRSGLVDWSGYEVTGVPKRVRDACAELVTRALRGETLTPDQDRSAFVKSESVGPISVTYADGAPSAKQWQVVLNLLAPYYRDSHEHGAPFFGTAGTEPGFAIGMHSDPGADSGFT